MKANFCRTAKPEASRKDSIPRIAFCAELFIVQVKINMIKTLAHICIFSKDLDRSRDFYCSALGLERHFDFFKDGVLFGFYLQVAPGQFIEIFKADPAAEIRGQRIHHVCLEVDDIDSLRDTLMKRGVEVTPKKLGCDQTWQCWCKDPDGTDVEFQQYTPKSSQFTKINCIVDW
jgi:catechol 2,3-dioxygenase-like lactoylglutathione lyase family enzyme